MALGWIDLVVVAGYFAATLAIGFIAGRRERTTEDFFLGGRKQPWLLAGMSIIATEVSAVTLIAVPAEAFRGNWNYLQMYAGSFLGRMLIIVLLLPAFYRGSVTTVYEYLGQRFGPATRATASVMFFVSRILGSGLRLLIAALAIAVVFDLPLAWVIVGAAGVAVAYATFGGIKSIMWTDAFQAVIFLAAAVTAVVLLFLLIPGNWREALESARGAGKFHTFTWDTSPFNEKSFWVLMIHATFLNMAALGTDQDLTQRMLTCSNVRNGQRSLLFNAFAGFPIVCTFLLIGSLLFVYYLGQPEGSVPAEVLERNDRIFPFFISTALPHNVGVKGLMVTAIFAAAMSSLSSALGALSSTAVTDFYRPYLRRQATEWHYLMVARASTVLFGVLLVGVALAFAGSDELLWKVFKWVSLVFGGLLGVFLLGVTTKQRGRDGVNALAMMSSVILLVCLMLYQERSGRTLVVWPWWVVIGTIWTYGLAVCFTTVQQRRSS